MAELWQLYKSTVCNCTKVDINLRVLRCISSSVSPWYTSVSFQFGLRVLRRVLVRNLVDCIDNKDALFNHHCLTSIKYNLYIIGLSHEASRYD